MKEHLITIHFVEREFVENKYNILPGGKIVSLVSNQESWDKLSGSMENYHSIGKANMPYRIGGVLTTSDIFSALNKIKTNVAPDDHITIIINAHGSDVGGKHAIVNGIKKISETSPEFQRFGIYTAELVKHIQEIFNQPINVVINSCSGMQAVKDIKELGVLMLGSKVMSTDSQFKVSNALIMQTTIESMMTNKEIFSFENFAKNYLWFCENKDKLPEVVNTATNASFISQVLDSGESEQIYKLLGEVLETTLLS